MDTSGPVGHVAVARGRDVLARVRLERRGQHASRLVPAVHEVLEEGGVDVDEICGVVVGEGPGSFTGVRVAAATAKGLARARDIPLWGVSSLAAGALGDLGGTDARIRYVLFDARGTRVYAACYGLGEAGLETLLPPHASDLAAVAGGGVPQGAVFVGDGALRHRGILEGAGHPVAGPPLGEPTADGLLHFLTLHPDTPPVERLQTWEPRYVKASSAEREWTPA
jgi:tRNA threonylcarbamoyl adenosine modification protein YeaZ